MCEGPTVRTGKWDEVDGGVDVRSGWVKRDEVNSCIKDACLESLVRS